MLLFQLVEKIVLQLKIIQKQIPNWVWYFMPVVSTLKKQTAGLL